MKKPHRQNVIGWILFVIFLFAAAGLGLALAVIFAPVKLALKDNSYTLSFLTHKESAAYADLVEVALLDESYSAKKITSYGGSSKAFGTYQNDEYGKHFRLTYSENHYNYILLKRANGKITVFNQKTKNATENLYNEIKKHLE